jgi:hypothetical protein
MLDRAKHMDLFEVAPYPDKAFQNDLPTQALITSRMKRQCRLLKAGFITMATVFFAAIGCGLFGWPMVMLGGLAVMGVIFVPFAFVLIYAPAIDCPHCGSRMKKDWAILGNGRSGEFMICTTCHSYLYTHRTLR